MKKVIAIVALVASLFITEKVQAQYFASYSPETFKINGSGVEYNGVSVGFLRGRSVAVINHGPSGISLSYGGQVRLNMRNDETGDTIKINETQILLDIPLLLKFYYHVEHSDFRVAAFTGPMFSFGIFGKTNTKTFEGNTQTSNTDTDWYGDKSNLNRFNYYFVIGGEVNYQRFTIFGGYRVGLSDLDKRSDAKLTTSGSFLGVGFGI